MPNTTDDKVPNTTDLFVDPVTTEDKTRTVSDTSTVQSILHYFDPMKLDKLDRHQVVWWDKTHHVC